MENVKNNIDVLKVGVVVAITGVIFLGFQNHYLQERLDAYDKGVIYKKAKNSRTGDYMYQKTKIAKDIQFLLKDYQKREKRINQYLKDTELDKSKIDKVNEMIRRHKNAN